ncbi:hypothetical protein HS125_15185 [bacterium]|nr:hypothetical protein [bacterium]
MMLPDHCTLSFAMITALTAAAAAHTPTPTATPTSSPTPTLVPPPNDTRAHADVVTTVPFTRVVDTRGAARSPDDPLQPCTFGGAYANNRSVWYCYCPVSTGKANVFAGGYDTVVGVWQSDGCAALTDLVACVDAFGRTTPEQFSFAVVEGNVYLIEVAAYGEGLGGDLVFALQGPAATVPASATCSPTPTMTPAGGGGSVGGATPVAPTATASETAPPSPTPTVTPGSRGGIVEDATPTATPSVLTSAPDYNQDGRVDLLDLMLLLDTRQKPPDSSQSAADPADYRDLLRLAEWWGRVVGGRP